ncbi:MAG TPA: hypothetical protein VFQ85_15250 [Mycobacteriales bacterium]|jgi:hypothetical protein|nr:hypothetical protein [Mycobacteriales bacterium]
MNARTLRLRREALHELTTVELGRVQGAGVVDTTTCQTTELLTPFIATGQSQDTTCTSF